MAAEDVDPSNFQGMGAARTLRPLQTQHLVTYCHYYGALQRVDWFVGRVLASLQARGFANNTLVVFTSDHGPSDLCRGKTTSYEFGLQVPLLVRWPGRVAPGRRSSALVSTSIDLSPTMLEVAGLDAPSSLPGHSLVAEFAGTATATRK